MEAIVIILLISLLFFELLSISDKNKEIRMLEIKLKVLNAELDVVNDIADYYYKSMQFNYNATYSTHQTKKQNTNNSQILDAIKYAMKKSHPDNGGNAEDFKKFRDLYNSMK